MIEGVEHDDKYRMVEDEFLTVAGDFTKHLHAAEYQRLKSLAKSQNAETIQNISRPVTGEMTDLVKRRQAALETATRQRKALRKLAKSDDDDLPPHDNTSLQGLMDSPRKKRVPLQSLSSFTSTSPTRPRRSGKPEPDVQMIYDSDEEDGDLDGPVRAKPVSRYLPSASRSSSTPQSSARLPVRREPHRRGFDGAALGASHATRVIQSPAHPAGGARNEDDPLSAILSRRDDQTRKRGRNSLDSRVKSESEAICLNEIPFL